MHYMLLIVADTTKATLPTAELENLGQAYVRLGEAIEIRPLVPTPEAARTVPAR